MELQPSEIPASGLTVHAPAAQPAREASFDAPGQARLWLWFSLSRATFATLPRVLMHEMPDEWQDKMSALLEEWDAAWNWPAGMGTRVCVTKDGKLAPTPPWLLNYRHPDWRAIEALRVREVATNTEGSK